MIRFLLRLLGFLILAGAFVALVIDGARSIAAGAISFTPLQATWSAAFPSGIEKTRQFFDETLRAVWVFDAVAAQPTFAVLGVLGILLMLLGRRRRRLVGVTP
ncbi:hypothetical protein ACIKTA_00420 [Hansschlegelia beijingensis]